MYQAKIITSKTFQTLMPSEKPRVTLYIDAEVKESLEILATRADRSVSNYVIQLIKQDIARAQASGELPPENSKVSEATHD